jgi:lysophospholipase L1-like esterase
MKKFLSLLATLLTLLSCHQPVFAQGAVVGGPFAAGNSLVSGCPGDTPGKSTICISDGSLPGSSSASMTASGVFNLNASSLLSWRKALANVRTGLGRGKIAVIGDSTSMATGAGASGALNLGGAFPSGWVQVLAARLASSVPTSTGSIICDQGTALAPISYATYDTRVTLGANWAASGSLGCIGGELFTFTAGAINNFSFTPVAAFDTIVVYYARGGGAASATVNVDGGASLGTLTFAGGAALVTTTFTVAKATHTINIVPVNDGPLNILGFQTFDSTTPAVDIVQLGIFGATTSTVGSASPNAWGLSALTTIAPSLTIIDLSINDSNNLTSLTTYTNSAINIINTAKTTGSVMLMSGPPSNTTQATNGTLATYVNALKSLAVSNNLPFLDLTTRWTSFAVTNPVLPYFDPLHPGKLGYQDIGSAVAGVLATP